MCEYTHWKYSNGTAALAAALLGCCSALHASEIAWVMAGFMPCAFLNAWN